MKNNIEWIIHLCANGNCDECGKREEGFLPYTCNAHTHGIKNSCLVRKCCMWKAASKTFQFQLFMNEQMKYKRAGQEGLAMIA